MPSRIAAVPFSTAFQSGEIVDYIRLEMRFASAMRRGMASSSEGQIVAADGGNGQSIGTKRVECSRSPLTSPSVKTFLAGLWKRCLRTG